MRRLWIALWLASACGAPETAPATARQPTAGAATAQPALNAPKAAPDGGVDAGTASTECAGPGCSGNARRIIVTSGHTEVLGPIEFAPDSSELSHEHKKLLEAIAATLIGNPDIRVVDVQGHADQHDTQPTSVAQLRADVVRTALIHSGVDPNRLTATGLGRTELGRRTVEFLITRRR